MEEKKLEKDLIFFNPGQSGSVFTYQAGFMVNDEIILTAQSHLEYETESPIAFVEERRRTPRTV
jgi:hypothetical protein